MAAYARSTKCRCRKIKLVLQARVLSRCGTVRVQTADRYVRHKVMCDGVGATAIADLPMSGQKRGMSQACRYKLAFRRLGSSPNMRGHSY